MEPFTLGRLVRAVGGVCSGPTHRVVAGVSTDSRSLRAGEVFFALSGPNFDGGAFVEAAFARGAAACVVAGSHAADDRRLVRVEDVGQALLRFAASYRDELNPRVVAITGSAGKTTTKELIRAMVERRLRAVAAPKSFNNAVGVPRTLFAADRRTEVVVLELGTNAPGEIAELAAVARPDVAVITCVGAAHEGRLGGPEGVAREKLSLLASLRPGGAAILNGDDPRLRAAARARPDAALCGLDGDCAWSARWLPAERALEVAWPGGEPLRAELPVPGRAFAQDALLALAAAERLGVEPAHALARLAEFAPPPGRFVQARAGGVLVVDDTYNANPTSVLASLDTFCGLEAPAGRAVVLGGMLELGEGSAAHHRRVGRAIAAAGVDLLVAVGDEARAAADGAWNAGIGAAACVDDAEGAAAALATLAPGWAVLFKGSRAFGLERAVRAVLARLSESDVGAHAA